MSTWQIFSDAGNDFRWEVSGRIIPKKPEYERNPNQSHDSSSRLSSMADLLLQGCSKLLENGGDGGAETESSPMFRTGLGKSVVPKQSSIAKALSVLGDDDVATDSGEVHARDNRASAFLDSVFQTGSGKSVNVSSAGLMRAKALLGLEDDNGCSNLRGFQHPRKANEEHWSQNISHLDVKGGVDSSGISNDGRSVASVFLMSDAGLMGSKLVDEVDIKLSGAGVNNSASKAPPIKFHTAGGRSLSVSSDALDRARSLLGDPDLGTFLIEGDLIEHAHSVSEKSRCSDDLLDRGKEFYSSFTPHGALKSKHVPKTFISPLRSSLTLAQSSFDSGNVIRGSNLIKKFDAIDDSSNVFPMHKPLCNGPCVPDTAANGTFSNCIDSRINLLARSACGPLVDISNTISSVCTNDRQTISEKRKLGRGSSISPFKRPRNSKFTTPLNKNVSFAPSGLSSLSSENSGSRQTVSSRYPFQVPRVYIKEYFGLPLSNKSMLKLFTKQERGIKPDKVDTYVFYDESGHNCIGVEAFHQMLAQSGASLQYISKEWIANHYKWIVWKLVCYDRCCPVKSTSNFLTVTNVLEELKYRYEREVNHGHRSAIKRILEGDAPPSAMLVLCISAIYISYQQETATQPGASNGAESSNVVKVELTDGWYAVNALLDVPLSKHLAAGKLFVGQKLRVWGAGLGGSVGPVSPLEASREVNLLLHINGTYRAHWADRLGFCKHAGPPLAFRCIKSNGGPVPQTIIGVTRIYPLLYKEKLQNGGSIVRSERMEAKTRQLYNQRCSAVIEGVASEFQTEMKVSQSYNDSDSEEGAKILRILETAAEPEVMMAEMSPEQLTSFASYQAKLEAKRRLNMEKTIQKALQDAGLEEREVIPFMRIRVVGLSKFQGKSVPKQGLVTIWNPTEKQLCELAEGQAYNVTGLLPVNSDSNTLYLQARGSTSKWQQLSPMALQHFQSFFSPRVSVSLSCLGEVPLSSEFDIATFVVYVGEAWQKKQWVFVTDCSNSMLQSDEISNSLLAISFSVPYEEDNSFAPINYNLIGSTVGFLNLIKRPKDQINNIWMAEATENSTFSFNFDSPSCSHLKNAAASTQSWAKISSLVIDKLKEKVLFIVDGRKS